ncbi:sigma-54-dependent Fis family transcriptional regulator [Salinibacter sp. 10B]|uniref:sigma 54-interacting transcriptional regulator n=1 Tax=Salinibacter sp. 10B TaxID=1923971 RepID=UPI000CF38A7B|nr:sigma 54-interacting transcriptional regulator [Salinibacter sp. 10B]PQJ34620.1 sigma-54-dependent Fis family transcriptional regulator [Salinibacter sp. 10B]
MDRASIQERFGIVGSSNAIKNVIDRARQVAKTDISVLLQGESGVGKELIAQALHELSVRRHEPMVVVNCGAIPEGLIESELFGAEKGAYTGAVEQRVGYFEEADGSTIFLDEIGEMPKEAQVRLLRVLETGKFSRVGASQQQQVDVRIVAATNKNLAEEVQAGRFRKDLYYRLSTVLIDIPPLRERPEDILPIFETFLHEFSKEYNSSRKTLTEDAEDVLKDYRWPGNVRELRNVAEQVTVLLRADEVSADELRPLLRDIGEAAPSTELMRVDQQEQRQDEDDTSTDIRQRELLYRAILEMRMDLRELKDQIGSLMSNVGVVVPRDVAERGDFPGDYDDFVVVRNAEEAEDFRDRPERNEPGEVDSLIRDVVYEVDEEGPARPTPRGERAGHREPPQGEDVVPESTARRPRDVPAPSEDESEDVEMERSEPAAEEVEEALPTLEEAEKQLISRALKQFDGNRRKTAQALGISERTLYRKLKDIDEDL